jgi:hypothetical protein
MHLFGPTLDHDCEHRQPEDDSQPVIDDSPDRKDHGGKLIMGVAGATFAIYSEESGGSPLWMETQNITADAEGNYAVQVGATSHKVCHWICSARASARAGSAQPRLLLLSVRYALKAADAQTLEGCRPPRFCSPRL